MHKYISYDARLMHNLCSIKKRAFGEFQALMKEQIIEKLHRLEFHKIFEISDFENKLMVPYRDPRTEKLVRADQEIRSGQRNFGKSGPGRSVESWFLIRFGKNYLFI